MPIKTALVDRAVREWKSFGEDLGRNDKFIDPTGKTTTAKQTSGHANPRKETVEPFAGRVADFWLAIPSDSYNKLVAENAKSLGKLDGTIDLAWSAAFISYCMRMAGAGPAFPYSSGHATWIGQSIKNKLANKLNASLVGFKLGEATLQLGDLIGRPRGNDAGLTYEEAATKGFFTSHTDIVVEIDGGKNVARVIGGNVGQSVSKSEVSITADGKLNDPDGWFVHIRNNI